MGIYLASIFSFWFCKKHYYKENTSLLFLWITRLLFVVSFYASLYILLQLVLVSCLVCLGAPPKKTLHNEFHWSLVIWLFAIYLDAPSNLTKKRKFLISWSGGKKYLFFGKFGGIFFLETPVLRFVLLSYYRRVLRYFAKYPSHWIVAELQWKKRSFFVLICF